MTESEVCLSYALFNISLKLKLLQCGEMVEDFQGCHSLLLVYHLFVAQRSLSQQFVDGVTHRLVLSPVQNF